MDDILKNQFTPKQIHGLSRLFNDLPFKISAPSMVFGDVLIENVQYLADIVDHIEIVLFQTDELDNLPSRPDIEKLKEIGVEKRITYSVHLPTSLEIASRDEKKLKGSIRRAVEMITLMSECFPLYYILHIPFTTPTLTPVPGCYFSKEDQQEFTVWTRRALSSLQTLHQQAGVDGRLLVENINYSPMFLEPMWQSGLCHLCLDLGHLLLGRENVLAVMKKYPAVTREIHLHGVRGHEEHLSLSALPTGMVQEWVKYLVGISYKGILNLEVFSPGDLQRSLAVLRDAFSEVRKK